jgi:3-methyladenine DNA glycosylase AlkD
VAEAGAVAFFRARFRAAGDARDAAAQKAYMKSALAFHGVDQKMVRGACAEFCAAHPELERASLRAAVDALYASEWFDLHSAAVGLLERKRALIGTADARWLIGLVRASACWAHVDWLATKIVPRALGSEPARARTLRTWARDRDFWVRRTALLAQLDELRAGGDDFALFEELAVPMLGEREFFIRKAIGWVLRDVSRKRPELTFAFAKRHGAAMSGLTWREATRRLPSSLRAKLPAR